MSKANSDVKKQDRLAPAAEKRKSKEVVPFDMLQWSLEDLRSPTSKPQTVKEKPAKPQKKTQNSNLKNVTEPEKHQKSPRSSKGEDATSENPKRSTTKQNGVNHSAKKEKKERDAPLAAKRARKEVVPFDMLQWALEDFARIANTPTTASKSKGTSNGRASPSPKKKMTASANGKAKKTKKKPSPSRAALKRSRDESDNSNETQDEESGDISDVDPAETDAALYVKMVTTARAPHKRKIKAADVAPQVGPDVGVDNNWLFSGALDDEDDSEFDESDADNF